MATTLIPPGTANDPGAVSPGEVVRHLQKTLSGFSLEQFDRIFAFADELREEDGTYLDPGSQPRSGHGFDLMPLVLGSEEWTQLESALLQRVRAWDVFLRDIYSGQEVLKAGIVPYEIVFADPNFHRGCSRLPGGAAHYLQLSAFDLERDAQGRWQVVEDYPGVAEGAGYALKKRQILRQVAPKLFEGWEVLPVEDFAALMVEELQKLAPEPEQAGRSVLLSRGEGDPHYLDHASLARQMGMPIVQGSDLLVFDSHLYLKTIAGVEKIDVVLRRLRTAYLDPVTFDPASRFGVPGLLSCVRRGSVAVANGLGSDLANNAALVGYLPAMIEYYLAEKPLIGSPPVLEMQDIDVREEVAEKKDDYIIRHVSQREATHEWAGRHLPPPDWAELWKKIESSPRDYVARKVTKSIQQPCWTVSGARTSSVTLRAFALGLDRLSPCALAWTGSSSVLASSHVQMSDRLKDVWILRGAMAPAAPVISTNDTAQRRQRLTSRVAENLFWIGRYAERAEVTARMLRIVQGQPWPGMNHLLSRQREPLWAALSVVTGHLPNYFFQPRPFLASIKALAAYLLLDRQHGGSVISCLWACRQNAENIREHLPPEVWGVLNRLHLQQLLSQEQLDSSKVQHSLEDRSLHQEIITQLDELTGAVEKHMLHNDAWHFWRLGVLAERSVLIIQSLREILAPPPGTPGAGTSSNLDLLLQMVAGQYAYRSLYHARPVAANVAQLLLQDKEFPRSIFFCLEGVKEALEATLGENLSQGADAPLQHCRRLIEELDFADLAHHFSKLSQDQEEETTGPEFLDLLDRFTKALLEFNVLVSDHYLDHQVVLREQELFEAKLTR